MRDFKKSLDFFWLYLKRYKLQLIVIMASVIVSTFLAVKQPEFLGKAIQELVNYLGQYLQTGSGDKSGFYDVVKLMILFPLTAALISFIQSIVMTIISGKSTNRMRIDLFKKLENLTIQFFDSHNDGEILSRFTSDLDNISITLNQSIHQILADATQVVVVLFMMFSNSVEMTLVVLATLPVALIAIVFIIKQAQKHINKQQKELGRLNGFADERFTGQKLIIANGLGPKMEEEFAEYNERVYQATYKGQLFSNLMFPLLNGMSLLTAAVVIFYGSWKAIHGEIPLTQIVALLVMFQQYTMMFYMPLTRVSSQMTQIQLAFTGAKRILEILEEEEEYDRPEAKAVDTISGEVMLDNVSFSYDKKTPILKDINIDVEQGHMVALVGHTGSGKTTIMNLLNRFYDVDQGAILYDGQDIRNVTLKSLRRHVGIVLQDSVIFTGTIRDNIVFGKRDATQEEVENAAKLANLHEFIMHQEKGYDTLVSEENNLFSVGQKQLLSIARTIITDPSLLILDEATSNVDTVTESRIQSAMDNVISGRTSFVIAHRLKTILNADKIIVLQQGEIVEEGTHESLLEQKGLYAELYENQFVFE